MFVTTPELSRLFVEPIFNLDATYIRRLPQALDWKRRRNTSDREKQPLFALKGGLLIRNRDQIKVESLKKAMSVKATVSKQGIETWLF